MKVNKEEAVCIFLAFFLVACQIALMPLLSSLFEFNSELTKAMAQIAGTVIISGFALVGVYKIPSSWHHQVIYDSTDDEE